MSALFLVYLVILVALVFDFINGMHDCSNSIATIVTTGVLKPFTAVIWAAFFNFIAFLFFHLNVATTIGTGLVAVPHISLSVILAALLGAISFNLLTWYLGLPSSSSHALVGGLIGAVVVHYGWQSLQWAGVLKVIIAMLLSPAVGLLLSFMLMKLLQHYFHKPLSVTTQKWARYLQLFSAALLSLGHGGNDAQKTMGVIASVLFSANLLGPQFYVPLWVIITCNLVMGLGTLIGGWRIVRTLGNKISQLNPLTGATAELAAASTLVIATQWGVPLSTTHTLTGAIAGVGMHGNRQITYKSTLNRIFAAWGLTLPMAALFSAGITCLKLALI